MKTINILCASGKKYKITIEILWQAHADLEQGSDVLARKLVKIVMYQPQKDHFLRGCTDH